MIIGIDPGAKGAIAVAKGKEIFVFDMPETRGDTISLIRSLGDTADAVVYMEKIAGFIPEGGASMMFEFGRLVERIGCVLECFSFRIIEVTPQAWQKALSLGHCEHVKAGRHASDAEKKAVRQKNAQLKRAWKNKLKAEAQRRFPGPEITLQNADSLLILDYARQQELATHPVADWLK
jgi:hypothetical protein